MRKLHHLAITKKITVVVTNHSSSNPDKDSKYSNASPFGWERYVLCKSVYHKLNTWMQNAWSINAVLNKRRTKGRQPLQLLIGDFGFMDAENNSAVKCS